MGASLVGLATELQPALQNGEKGKEQRQREKGEKKFSPVLINAYPYFMNHSYIKLFSSWLYATLSREKIMLLNILHVSNL